MYIYTHRTVETGEDWVPCLHLDLLHQLHNVIGQALLVRHGVAADLLLSTATAAAVSQADWYPVTQPALLQRKTGLQRFKHKAVH